MHHLFFRIYQSGIYISKFYLNFFYITSQQPYQQLINYVIN